MSPLPQHLDVANRIRGTGGYTTSLRAACALPWKVSINHKATMAWHTSTFLHQRPGTPLTLIHLPVMHMCAELSAPPGSTHTEVTPLPSTIWACHTNLTLLTMCPRSQLVVVSLRTISRCPRMLPYSQNLMLYPGRHYLTRNTWCSTDMRYVTCFCAHSSQKICVSYAMKCVWKAKCSEEGLAVIFKSCWVVCSQHMVEGVHYFQLWVPTA